MGITRIRSRILQYFSKDLLRTLNKICRNSTVSDNNLKVDAMLAVMREHDLDFIELGPGTNRLAILIDNYVFKIALDKWGVQDNVNEFTMSQELQPYVVKTYETNDLISVCEYVTVISREEFEENKEQIRRILAVLSESYLLGDVGTVSKNFCNWGYRDNGELVILDFAYVYRVKGDELLCSKDQAVLEYDENFHNLKCPVCARKYTFMDLRRRIPMEEEKHENVVAKQLAYKLTQPIQEFSDGYKDEDITESLYTNKKKKENKEVTDMRLYSDEEYISPEEQEESYLEALALVTGQEVRPPVALKSEEQKVLESVQSDKPTNTKIVEYDKETPTDKTHIRVIQQSIQQESEASDNDMASVLLDAGSEIEDVSDFDDDMEDFISKVSEEVRNVRSDAAVFVDQEHTVESGEDGSVIERTKVGVTVIDPAQMEDRIIEVELEDKEADIYRDDTDDECEEGKVVLTNTTHLTDNIKVQTSVEIQGNDSLAESLRRQLSEQTDEERQREELEEKYAHLISDNDEYDNRRKGGRQEWE